MKQGHAVKGSAVVIAITSTAPGRQTDIRARMKMIRKPLAGLTLGMAMATVAAPVAAQTANTKTIYTYDALDRLTQVTDPSGLTTTYQFDGLSDETKLTSPDTGVKAKTYDAAGNVLTALDANGNTVTYTYDAQNRRLSASYADTTQNITYTYDESNAVTGCTTSFPIGHLTRIVENAVTTVFCYNAQGYVIQKSQAVSGHTDVTSYTRSPSGKILSITHPSGDQVAYSYDADGHISGVTATTSSGTTTLVSNATYLPFGPISGYTLGNGQAVTRTYDANYRLTDLTSPAFTLHVARDAMGDITAIGNNPGASPATETYSYDPLYRLTAITEAGGTTLESVTYNQTGDRLSKTGSGLATGAYSYNRATHQLVATGNAVRTVDANGNTTAISQAGGTYGFGYNMRNRMVLAQLNQSTIAAYTYNADGERVAKTANGSTERYNYGADSQLLSEYGATNREYVYLNDIPVANLDTQGATMSVAYVTADQLSTPRAIADSSGATTWSWAYQGNAWSEQAPTSNGYTYNLRFPGQYFDAETGLHYNNRRDYDPATGRYQQVDPIGFKGGLWTLYAYVGSNPLSYRDPLGMDGFSDMTAAFCPNGSCVPPGFGQPGWQPDSQPPSPPPSGSCGCARLPDYDQFQIDWYVFSLSATYTKYGDVFAGFGVNRGYPNPVGYGVSIASGWMLKCDPSQSELNDFISGASGGFSAYYGFGGGYSANPSGSAITVGVGYGIGPGGGNNWYQGNILQ
ncbi:RHS repeat-associated core domain-containing protein [Dyella choica]|uniref:RHS repeat protein n=1 Tax=Dyella choica TaxID=1927959 RepID=A0A3S0S8N2_9GAMM|nr:RHS repeat-associated core domain-containing protein [Dyella choica]RUL72998.1 RHS repeat protein [Dyella choica]